MLVDNSLYIVAEQPFQVEGFPFLQSGEANSEASIWEMFRTLQPIKCTFEMRMVKPSGQAYQIESYLLNGQIENLYRFRENILATDKAWKHCYVLYPCDPFAFQVFTNQVFLTHAVQQHMVQLHASLLDDHGRGVVFLGPSGIGKTTQAERWSQHRGASILNGDMVFVQEVHRSGKQYLGWGTPWHGSSPYCINTSTPIKALVILKQTPYNALRELTGFEKVQKVSGSVFYPTWMQNGMELCLDTLNNLLTDLPVYQLDNRADEEAVDLLAAELDRIT